MVWIHGGGFQNGANSEDRLNGTAMASSSGNIVININYRLAGIGFLALEALAKEDPNYPTTGNYGLVDQRFALQWVQKNIAQFGGNPTDVTIMGESAGGASVMYHLVMPKSFPFFQKGIVESGYGLWMKDLHDAENDGNKAANQLNCKGTDAQILQCLRDKPWKDIIGLGEIDPIIDGYHIVEPPFKTYTENRFNQVPVMAGDVRDEGSGFTYWIFPHPVNESTYENWLRQQFGSDLTQQLLQLYPCQAFDNTDCWKAMSQVSGDQIFICETTPVAAVASRFHKSWIFVFSHHPTWDGSPFLGAYHSAEIEFVFSTVNIHPHSQQEINLSQNMTRYWTNFARYGDPNGSGKDGLIFWPPYDNLQTRMDFNIPSHVINSLEAEQCAFWEKQFPK